MEERKRLVRTWATALSEQPHQPATFDSLFDCLCFFHMLRLSAPVLFPDEEALTANTEGNWVVRKENAVTLAMAMNRFAIEGLQARDDFDVRALVDVVALAKGADEALLQLSDLVITFLVLSFTPEKKQVMSRLSQEDQKNISQNVRRCIALYSLKSYKRSAAVAPAAAAASTGGGGASSVAVVDAAAAGGAASSLHALQDEVASLQRQLAERANAVSTLESRIAFVETEKSDVTSRYHTLLAEHDAQSRQHTTEQELYQQMAKKDTTIRELHSSLDATAEKLTQQKQRYAALETDLDTLRARHKDTMAQLKTATTARYDTEQDLKLLQDRFDVASKGRKEVEAKHDSLEAEVATLRAKLHTAAGRDGDGVDDDAAARHNLSDVDTQAELMQALGRIRQLESELGMLKRSGFGAPGAADLSGTHTLHNQSSYLEDTSRVTEEASATVDVAKLAALEEELARERGVALAALKEKESLGQHLHHALSQLADHKDTVQELGRENMQLKQQAVEAAAGDAAVREAKTLRATLAAMQTRFEERRDMASREKAVLVSTMARYGHRNLLLQQRELLAPAATVAAAQQQQQQTAGGTLGLVVASLFSGGAAADATADVSGSFLTKHRRVLERGLLDAACSISQRKQ